MPSFKRTTSAAAVALSLWATPVSAEPVSTAIAAIGAAFSAGGIFAQGTVLGFLARTAAGMALSALANALTRRGAPKPPGIKTEATTSGGTEPQTIILGRYATAGHHAAPPYSGRHLVYVIDIADMPITGINRVIINEEYVDWEPSPSGNLLEHRITGDSKYVGSSPGAIVANFYDGAQTEADAFLLDRFGNHPTRPWQADMVGTGIAYAVMRFRANRDVYSGLPRVRFEVDGAALYDPREDSSVGGDGPQRWDDPATWEFSQNPAVMIYNVFRGIALPDGTVWGYEFDADDLPLSNWFAAMNECDVPVDLDGGGTEPQYRAGIEVKIGPQDLGGDAPADIVEDLLNACSGEIAEIGGTVKIRVGAPTLPVLFVTDDDIVVTSPDDYAPFPGLHETHNGVTATHPSPEALWEPVDAPPRYSADFEAEDADRRLVGDVTLNAVTSDTQVQRLMRAWVEDERRWRRHNITLSPRAAILEPLDTFEWTSERNGYLDKLFEARGVTHTRTINQAVACRERDPSDYDWSSDFEFPVVLPDPASPLPDPDVPADWAAFPTVIKDAAGGDRRPAIRLIWTQGENTDATALEWQVRVAGQADLAAQGTTSDVALGEVIVSEGVLPGESYEARGRFVADRPMDWTAWAPVTTPDVRLGEVDFAQAVRDRIDEIQDTADDASARHDAALGDATGALGDLRDAAMAAYGPLDVEVSLRDAVMAAYGPLDVEVSLSDRVQQADRDITFTVASDVDIDERLDLLSERAAELAILLSQTDKRMADAGVFVDPENGRVRIQADGIRGEAQQIVDGLNASIQQRATFFDVDEAISKVQLGEVDLPVLDDITFRLTTAEQIIDAQAGQITTLGENLLVDGTTVTMTDVVSEIDILEGQISERVTITDFNELGSQVSEIEQDLGDFDGPRFRTTLRDVSTLNEEVDLSGVATLRDLLTNYGDRKVINEAISLARQDMWARADATDEAVAGLRVDLGVSFQNATSLIQQESNVRASEFESFGEIVDQIETTITDPETGLEAQGEALSLLDSRVEDTEDGLTVISRDTTVISAAVVDASDDAGLAGLRSQLDDYETRRRLDAGVSQVRQDSNAVVEEGREALATTRQELTAALQSADARITNTQSALATEEQARIEQVTELEGRVEDNEGTLTQINLVDVTSDSALVQAYLGLEGQVNDPDTGLPATHGTVTDIISMNLDPNSAIISRFQDIEVELDPESDNSIAARLSTVETVKVDESGAIAAIDALVEAQFGDLSTFTEFQQWAIANEDGTNAGFLFGIDGQNVISAVKVDENGDEDPSTTLELAADQIRLNGNTSVDGTFFTDILAAEEAWIGTANIVDLSVSTVKIAGNAVSEAFAVSGGGDDLIKNAPFEIVSLVVEVFDQSPVAITYSGEFRSSNDSETGALIEVDRNGVFLMAEFEELSFTNNPFIFVSVGSGYNQKAYTVFDQNPPLGINTYTLSFLRLPYTNPALICKGAARNVSMSFSQPRGFKK